MKANADTALERLRCDLEVAAAKRNIEYSRIHEKRLEIISELAGKLDTFYRCIGAYVSFVEPSSGSTKEERRKLASNALVEFTNYVRPRRFFLPERTIKKMDDFINGLFTISVDFMIYVEEELPKDMEVWKKANEYTTTEAPKLLKELEDDFRRILGADSESA